MYNDYIIELPKLENCFDEKRLWDNCKNNEHHIDKSYGVEYYKVTNNQPEVKHIFEYINKEYMFKELVGWYIHKFKSEWIKPHTDIDRNAIIMFPIQPKKYKITFLDNFKDENILFEHEYSCPTIVNSNIPHCVYDKGIDRYFFQISLFIKNFDWNNVIKLVNNDELIRI